MSRDVIETILDEHVTYMIRILFYTYKGYKAPAIAKFLLAEGISCTHESVNRFLLCYKATKCIHRKVGSGTTLKVAAEIKQLVEEQM